MASEVGILCVTLIFILVMILTVKMEGMFKEASVLSFFMKEYTIPCHDRGHINVMLVLQSCTDSLQVLRGSCSETFPTSPDGTYDVSSIEVEKDVVVIDEGFMAINEGVAVRIKQEEIPEDITFPDIKPEPDEVSYVCICLLLDTFHQYPEMSVVFVMPVYLAIESATRLEQKIFGCHCLFWGWGWGCVGESVLNGLVCV